jgi:hypothetical protein
LDRTGKGHFGVLKFRGWVRITEPFPEDFKDSEEVKDRVIESLKNMNSNYPEAGC